LQFAENPELPLVDFERISTLFGGFFMEQGFDEAKAQRNWLERLGEKIPGFRGFQDRELRREVDKLQREYLASQLTQNKSTLRKVAERYTDAGKIGVLHLFDRIDKRLDGLARAVQFSDYGATGFFDVIKVDEAALEELYQFDLALLEELSGLGDDMAAIPAPAAGDPTESLEVTLDRLQRLEDRWAAREGAVNKVVKTAGD
jgi:hypothetical protein